MSEVVKSDLFALCPFQNDLQPCPDRCRISGGILVDRRGEHPAGSYTLPVCPENIQNRDGEDDAAVGSLGFRLGDEQPFLGAVDLPLYPKLTGAEIQIAPLEGADLASA